MTVVNDLTRGRVLYVAEDRKRESLDGFWGTLTDSQRAGIEAVAMDMWDPYVTSCWRVLYIIEDRPSW
jgi:transposase